MRKKSAKKPQKEVPEEVPFEDDSSSASSEKKASSPVNGSVDVNTTSNITPKVKPLKAARKTPAITVTMKTSVDPKFMEGGINLQDLVVDPPLATAKPGEEIPKPQAKQLPTPDKKAEA